MRTILLSIVAALGLAGPANARVAPPPAGAAADYQIGGAYPPPPGTRVVTRDWHDAPPARGRYSVCYVNAYQTQSDAGADGGRRPDLTSAWPADLVLRRLGEDPGWPGEYLVDLSTAGQRARAAAWVGRMIDTCARRGYRAVELDNLDSWTRFDGTEREGDVPFGRAQAVDFARRLVARAHARGLAAAQKNTAELTRREARGVARFDFAVSEQCGVYRECGRYRALYGVHTIDVEYTRAGFRAACRTLGGRAPVVLRDLDVSTPGTRGYVDDRC